MSQNIINSFVFGGDTPAQPCSAKYIEGLSPEYQAYTKDELWVGSGNQFTFAGFFQVPAWMGNGGAIIMHDYFDITFRYWYDGFRKCRFDIDIYTPGWTNEYRLETADLYPDLTIGEWFCLMYSIDTSPAGAPTRSAWLHKVGDNSATDLFVSPTRDNYATGPGTAFEFDNTDSKWTIGANTISLGNGQNYNEGNFIIHNEYVDWDDANNRAKIVDPDDGSPVSLGSDGSLLTGNPAKIYLPDGDGSNNQGTAGDFTETNGPIVDSTTSACD